MASIRQFLLHGVFIDDLKATDKSGVIREFAERLHETGKVQSPGEVVKVLSDREVLGSTGIGDGVAVPHGKFRNWHDIIIAVGRSRAGVDFHSLDGKPVFLFFVLLTPGDQPGDHLKILARISRILKNPRLREDLRGASSAEEMQRMIIEEDGKLP